MHAAAREACVVGAGLAGAAVAAALCRRGWQVTQLCAGDGPADGASALPVGALSPHVTRSPTPMSRLTALGVPATVAELQRLVPEGQGWRSIDILNLDHDPGPRPAVLVRPAALVQAWIDEGQRLGRLHLRTRARVRALIPQDGAWQVQLEDGQTPITVPVVVVAAALGSAPLLAPLGGDWPLRPVQGQLSLGPLEGPPLTDRPLRRDGVFMPCYEDAGLAPTWPTRIWTVGSTFRRGATDTTISAEAHQDNLQRLRAMAPEAAAVLGQALTAGRWSGWAGVRCASLDRLPLAGPVPDTRAGVARGQALADVPRLGGLHACCGLGSRGLALSALLGDSLAAVIDGAPSPLPPPLQDAVDPARFWWRAQRRARH